ncbi:MAG: VWA domain-containing protein [Treponema sp.]|nr:VWA domain-containing protein [Treponema sp.]
MISFLFPQTGFAFESPAVALAALVVLPLALALARRAGSPFRASVTLGAPGGVPFRLPFSLEKIVRLLRWAEIVGVALLFLAAAGPVLRTAQPVWLGRGADVIFVIDISPSMAALDMDGASRFNVARELIADFALRRPADGIGLVGVGTDAALLLPPTMDRLMLDERLAGLQVGELGEASALGMGLAVAASHIARSEAPRRSVVLITDGENNAGAIHPETAAAMARDSGASLWIIGVGTGGVVPIDYLDPFTRVRLTGWYDSAFDTGSLARIGAAGDGQWFLAQSRAEFARAFDIIDERELVVLRGGTETTTRDLGRIFLTLALALISGARFVRRFFLGAWL